MQKSYFFLLPKTTLTLNKVKVLLLFYSNLLQIIYCFHMTKTAKSIFTIKISFQKSKMLIEFYSLNHDFKKVFDSIGNHIFRTKTYFPVT